MRGWVGVLLLLGACSSTTPFPSDDIAIFDGGPTFDSTLPKDATSFDVAPDGPTFNGGGPFDCNHCTCDGTLNYCAEISGGNMPLLDAGDDAADAADASDAEPACDPDAAVLACKPIPIECLPKPSCACLMKHYTYPCTCDLDPSGNGLVVSCAYP